MSTSEAPNLNQNEVNGPIVSPPDDERWGEFRAVRDRVLGGILIVLPIFITFYIVIWLYRLLNDFVISPVARLLVKVLTWNRGQDLPELVEWYVAPVLALAIVVVVLYFLGYLARTTIHQAIDQVLLKVPGVTVIYNAVRNVFRSMEKTDGVQRFSRVVLIGFPHPGMKVPAFVTSSCVDEATGKKILCLYVPTTPIPTSGYMILVPEEETQDVNWTLDQTLQAVVSGGISVPPLVRYHSLQQQSDS